MTDFRYLSLEEADQATGTVVVIDVLRAFTTAAYAFAGGATRIMPVKSVADALKLQKQVPGSLVMGEVDGFKPKGFDFGNSPAEIMRADLHGKILIQRSSAGTQGIIKCVHADRLFSASFVVARPTAMVLRGLDEQVITFLITGASLGRDGDEDQACGEYIAALIRGENVTPNSFTERVWKSTVGKLFLSGENEYLCQEDIEMSVIADLFPFYMSIHWEQSLYIMSRKMLL